MTAPDLILAGAVVRTLDPARPYATAVAVRDGVIAAVGDESDVRHWRGPGTEVVPLAGAHLVPGLVDAHSHPVWGLDMATGVDLSGVADLAGLRAALAGAERVDGWVVGFGLDHNAFEGRAVDRALVEDVLGGAPAFLRLYDGHSALVSGAALALAGVAGARDFAQRSEVVCDGEGRPTGHLVEHAAMELVAAVVPGPSYAARRARLVELLAAMAATGLTGAHVMDAGDPELVAAVAQEAVLPVRLRFAPWCMPGVDEAGLEELVALQGRGGRHWVVDGVKFFMDGTVEGVRPGWSTRTAMGRGPPRSGRIPPRTAARYGGCTRPECVPPRTPSGTRPCGTSSMWWRSWGRGPGAAPGGTHRNRSRRVAAAVRRARGGRLDAAAAHRLHTGRRDRRVVPAAGRRPGRARLAATGSAGRRCDGRPGLGLAHRPLRRAGRAGERACAAGCRVGAGGAHGARGAGGLHHACRSCRGGGRPGRAGRRRAAGRSHRARTGPGRGSGGRGGAGAGAVDGDRGTRGAPGEA